MNKRLWRHVLSTAALESYELPIGRVAVPGQVSRTLDRTRALLDGNRSGKGRRLIDELSSIVAVPPEIPRADYRTWRGTPFPQNEWNASYGVKGGASRTLLFEKIFGIEYPVSVRDIDIVRFGFRVIPTDRAMAERFMPRDAENGAGVELVRSLEEYLSTRDLSVNEVLWISETLTASHQAITDMATLVLRPSRVLFGTLHRPPAVRGRTVLKMVRLAVEGHVSGIPWKIVGLPEVVDVSEFDLALELGRVLERGTECARLFLETLRALGLLPDYENDDLVAAVMEDLEHFSLGNRAPLPPRERTPTDDSKE